VGGVFWVAYVPSDFARGGAARVALEQVDLIHRMTAASPDLQLALTPTTWSGRTAPARSPR
jgi:hypothetical protein